MKREMPDYRYGSLYGWDSSVAQPKEKDLVVVITDRPNDCGESRKGKVVRLIEDRRDRQTVEVTDDLIDGYGTHSRFGRREIRALTSRDVLKVEET